MTRHISVNVGGLWRTKVELTEKATWFDLRKKILKVTGIYISYQLFVQLNKDRDNCELEDGDDVFCDWYSLYGDHPLHYAATIGNIEAIRSWLASGADIDVLNNKKETPLMRACRNCDEECVKELLQLGANAKLIDENNKTLLHHLAYGLHTPISNNNIEKIERIAKILIKEGCNSMIKNSNNETFVDIVKWRDYTHTLATKMEEWMKEYTKI
jgi:hypothetical protein